MKTRQSPENAGLTRRPPKKIQTEILPKILINSRSETTAQNALQQLAQAGIAAEIADTETVCRQADILITVTNATAPLFQTEWIRPGTHISAMGADQSGKQELPLALVQEATLFADLPVQSRAIGEFEAASKIDAEIKITAMGAVLTGDSQGRREREEVTVFDSSGIALQDLCIAQVILDQAIARGLVDVVAF